MSIKISNLPLKVGNDTSTGWLPISINGVTYKIHPNQLNSYSLVSNAALITDATGNITNSLVSAEELLNVKGSTSNIQTQINAINAYVSGITANYVDDAIVNGVINRAPSQNIVYDALLGKASLDSPEFIGVPLAPTASSGTSTTQIANTKFVHDALSGLTARIQNSMAVDGTGTLIPTVDAVNKQANYFALGLSTTGFISDSDTFTLSRLDNYTLTVNQSSVGIIFKNKLAVEPYAPSAAILQVPQTNISLTNFGLTTDGIYIKFLGYNSIGNFVISDTSYIGSKSVAQLGVLTLKTISGVTTFLDSVRGVKTVPSVAGYSNLENTMLGIQSSISIKPNAGTLTVLNTNGSIKGISVNWGQNSNNDDKPISGSTTTIFTHIKPNDLASITPPTTATTVDTTKYWNGSALVNLSANGKASVQRWILTINGQFFLQYGEFEYGNLLDAIDAIDMAVFSDVLPKGTYCEIARMAAVKNASDLNDNAQAVFKSMNGIGGTSTSSGSIWGHISGAIDDQLDLKAKLDSKFSGSGTTNNIPMIISGHTLGNSHINDMGSHVSIGNDLIVDGSISIFGGLSNGFLKADGSIDTNAYAISDSDTLQAIANRGNTTTTTLIASGFVKSGGTGSQFLMANGSVLSLINSKITGTTNTLPKITGAGAVDSNISDDGTTININGFVTIPNGKTIMIGTEYAILSNDIIDGGVF